MYLCLVSTFYVMTYVHINEHIHCRTYNIFVWKYVFFFGIISMRGEYFIYKHYRHKALYVHNRVWVRYLNYMWGMKMLRTWD